MRAAAAERAAPHSLYMPSYTLCAEKFREFGAEIVFDKMCHGNVTASAATAVDGMNERARTENKISASPETRDIVARNSPAAAIQCRARSVWGPSHRLSQKRIANIF